MRRFNVLGEAILEIRRDVYKGAVQTSSRVQSQVVEQQVHELTNYQYLIDGDDFPALPQDFVEFGIKNLPLWQKWEAENPGVMKRWFLAELHQRVTTDGIELEADSLHPELSKYLKNGVPDYTYSGRLPKGWLKYVIRAFRKNVDSRRVFLPIYHPIDFFAVSMFTRIPCTIGYHFMVRQIPGSEVRFLEVNLVQRSVDYNKFWFSDLGFAYYMAQAIQEEVFHLGYMDLQIDKIRVVHTIMSFHSFFDNEEIF